MAIFRCNKCAYLQEVPAKHIGKTAKCPRCQQEGAIYDAVSFIEKIIGKYLMQAKVLRELQEQLQPDELESSTESTKKFI
jgi:phage FluMu protein Com